MFKEYGPSPAQRDYGDDLEQLKKLQEAIQLYHTSLEDEKERDEFDARLSAMYRQTERDNEAGGSMYYNNRWPEGKWMTWAEQKAEKERENA
jgi:hypothetical protein